jgi:hypothetical protein
MREFIGVTHLHRINRSLKQEALIFQKVGVCNFDLTKKLFNFDFEGKDELNELINELEWMIDQGLAFSLNHQLKRDAKSDSYNYVLAQYEEEHREDVDQFKRELDTSSENFNRIELVKKSGTEFLDIIKDAYRVILEGHKKASITLDYVTRLSCIELRESGNVDAFPLTYSEKIFPESAVASKTDIVRVVLKALPIPDENTSWEQIIDYRNDSDTAGKFLALRRWITTTARAQIPANELEEELEWLLFDYQRHLNLHKLKTNWGAFETIVTVGAEFLENIARIRWGKAAKLLFTLKHRKVDLMEAEMKAPGAEVAYIVKSRSYFDDAT